MDLGIQTGYALSSSAQRTEAADKATQCYLAELNEHAFIKLTY